MAEATVVSRSETQVVQETQHTSPTLVLKLSQPKNKKDVKWTTDTIDNEHMNKKKSKCCCIYERPKTFGESSDEDDDDCTEHCRGHKHKCYRKEEKGAPEVSGADEPGPSTGSNGS